MTKKPEVPDAWDDDWETQADRVVPEDQAQTESQIALTKSERLAQHAETNRKLWESAETPQTLHYVEASNPVPLAAAFKPQVKVLSRKPVIAKRDPVTGMSQLTVADDDEEEPSKAVQLTPEEIRAKQKRDREEKQRRYDEARAKIFGESAPSSGASSPGTVTPPRSDAGHVPRGRSRGRGGGGAGAGAGIQRNNDVRELDSRRQTNASGSGRELYDPNYASKPELAAQRRTGDSESPARASTPKDQQPAIRAPRGPDSSGRRGFGFARRGDKET